MKTDREMAQDILCKVNDIKKERRIMRNGILGLTALTCAFALIFMSVFSFYYSKTQPESLTASATTEASPRTSAFLMVASAASESETPVIYGSDVTLPMGGILIAENTKGMTSEKKDAIMLRLKERLLSLYGKDCAWLLKGTQEDVTVYFGTADILKLKIENCESVDNVTISCTDNGKLTVSDKSKLGSSPSEYIKTVKQGASITVTGKEYAEIYGKAEGMRIEWFLSDNMTDIFRASPDTPLSAVKDEITVKINYSDGSNETYTVSFSFDDEGMLSAKCTY